ncbi:dimethyl sulfoxide reductase anchor subunit family protein [Rhodobium gokarnense]|uniref:DMSO reductase anchor subunit n=1 Tax=Rhodobium gokarnense TaxID=364296 RepID=A0ABT3H791_9HYPH|nr:DmsC/YnfH family molybdoenzyme membrane anchor subunit [Rhodobium gokarnense]MCW2306267.1 DMSO reductase anchor subunit [Rhodobium gokarnense]
MHPAFSVIFLTVLAGLGQGLFLAMTTAEIYDFFELLPVDPAPVLYIVGSALAFLLLIGGLIASFFHLGRPERAWRAAAMWRTSWLSREVIIMPAVIGLVFIYGAIHYLDWNPVFLIREGAPPVRLSLLVGVVGTVFSFGLFVCTAMIYACLKFLQEWHSPLTVLNYILLGGASGFVLATALAAYFDPALTYFYGGWAIVLTVIAFVTRGASLIRNARLRPKSTPQTAIGVHHDRIVQRSMGALGGTFNTREFFHGAGAKLMKLLRPIFLTAVFVVPVILTAAGIFFYSLPILVAAVAVQVLGLLVERWYFFAEANHPQNIYYRTLG